MQKLGSIMLQILAFVLFAVTIGYFSNHPEYVHLDPGKALIKVNFSHAGEIKEACRKLTQEELNKLAPNMRNPLECKRERVPLLLEISLDNKVIVHELLQPTGLARDGSATVYRRFTVEPGQHTLTARMIDGRDRTEFDFEKTRDIQLLPGQNFVIDFKKDAGGFIFLN